ncbi:MAG TPA: histone deacetylase [Syntrophus sp. (in: bacteria)]|nr:histone deacetylase [Syntrophus sp. (in: bacteria)]
MFRKTGVVKDRRYLDHGRDVAHPESYKRLRALYEILEAPNMMGKFTEIEPRYATYAELEMIHERSYIDFVADTAGKEMCSLDPDTITTAETYDVARLAVGGLCRAVDAVVAGEVENAFALIRPPGHHAEADEAAGFCIFNNVAIAAKYALEKHKLKRVLIVDWDLHHGNGTQNAFYADRRVLYCSTHESPGYPGTGALEEIGQGKGLGYTINIPLKSGAGTAHYVKVFRRLIAPVAMTFRPDLILVSAGFDIYSGDPLGGMKVTPRGFAYLTRILMDVADACANGRIVLSLEGGYNVEGLTMSVTAVIKELSEATYATEDELRELEESADTRQDAVIRAVMNQLNPFWKVY